ncbi:2'-5'-oligoadenylate synthase 1A-like [Acanthaster planci]|uniref:2'-5'-oligoadenylate synthase 1A-like n=1 Tax=Acanthaster planci TaxID=133434 RepID=A0A8B7YUN5_ACAPL|nr:2'-5'-oligoadenylate synthase 1A-like [Acanthaster planci]
MANPRQPWCLPPESLEVWYNEKLQEGTGSFNSYCREAVDNVVRALHRICSTDLVPFDVDRVIKSGSLGKGTVVKELSDVDLVAFVNPPHLQPIVDVGPQTYKYQLDVVLRDMVRALRQLQNVTDINNKGFLLKFKLTNIGPNRRSLSIDLMATSDCHLSDSRAKRKLFDAMLQQRADDRRYYSPAVIENQLEFVRDQPGALKALIRLVKYWAYQRLPDHLQKSYRLELITIHRWENAGSPLRFSKAQGLKDVLQVLSNMSQLQVYWERHYDASVAKKAISHFKMQRPIVLDPSEPTDNVCNLYMEGNNLQLMRAAATTTLQSRLLQNVFVRQGWN